MEFRQLLPVPGTVELEPLLDSLWPPPEAPAQRPHVAVNFVTSVDGRSTHGGRSGALGDEGDRAMFHGLRQRADAVLAGTETLRVERYGRLVADKQRRARRASHGFEPEPLACIITRSGHLPLDIPLFSEPEARVVVYSAAPLQPEDLPAHVEAKTLAPDRLTAAALEDLRTTHGIRTVLCEGGARLFGSLVREELADELFLTVPPKLVGGGSGPSITSGEELPHPAALRLRWVLERNGSLFLRYALG